MKSKSGFTLVEVLVVTIVIAILTTIAIIGNHRVQQSARDSKRKADIVTLANELEKYYERYGEYPRTCTNAWGSICSSGSELLIADSLAKAKETLPGLRDDFGDPRYKSGQFISGTVEADSNAYYYLGGLINGSGSAATGTLTATYMKRTGMADMNCRFTYKDLQPGKSTAYIIGYYSESDNVFKLYSGAKGLQLYPDPTPADDRCKLRTL